MADHISRIQSLENKISTLESRLSTLRTELAQARSESPLSFSAPLAPSTSSHSTTSAADVYLAQALDGGFPDDWRSDVLTALSQPVEEAPNTWPLSQQEYKQYGRQLIMPEVGLQGQLKLKHAKVLVVGAGGLGCPAIAYLAGAGLGTLGLVDEDTVEESNLHRQILHTVGSVGMGKVSSAKDFVRELNPLVKVETYQTRLSSDNALEVVSQYDVVLDCTDTPASRYLISDACVLLGKPLVSASALRTEGQLTVFNHPPRPSGDSSGGPCYRCIFPNPSPPETVVSCGDGGILGPVVGVMGVLQALEAIKVVVGDPNADGSVVNISPPSMLLFSAYSTPQFRSVKLRRRNAKCLSCSAAATVTAEALTSGSMDYVQFCGIANPINILSPEERISATQYAEARKNISLSGKKHQVIDVREKVQFELCHLYGSINVPFSVVQGLKGGGGDAMMNVDGELPPVLQQLKYSLNLSEGDPLYVVCRLGNDSQIAVRRLKELGFDRDGRTWIGDVRGGLKAWRVHVDPSFPEY